MEISEVLESLEALKEGLASVKSANNNVERAVLAAQKICEAFRECSSEIESFPKDALEPIQGKITEISVATSQMVSSFSKSIEDLQLKTNGIVDSFNESISNSCIKIRNDVNEFHREIEALDSKLSRVTSRVEEKTNDVVAEVCKISSTINNSISESDNKHSKLINDLGEKIVSLDKSIIDRHDKDIAYIKDRFGSTVDSVRSARNTIIYGLVVVSLLVAASIVALSPLAIRAWQLYLK